MSETMTEKPDDISQEAWDAARHALSIGFTVPIKRRDVVVSVAQALSAAEARGREAAWQTMDSAPKDGTHFLAYEPTGDMYRAAYGADGTLHSYCGQYVTEPPEPTHWQPAPPSPPSAKD